MRGKLGSLLIMSCVLGFARESELMETSSQPVLSPPFRPQIKRCLEFILLWAKCRLEWGLPKSKYFFAATLLWIDPFYYFKCPLHCWSNTNRKSRAVFAANPRNQCTVYTLCWQVGHWAFCGEYSKGQLLRICILWHYCFSIVTLLGLGEHNGIIDNWVPLWHNSPKGPTCVYLWHIFSGKTA